MPQFGDNMRKFRALNGSVIEVSDEHAEEVLVPQGNFKEVFEKKNESKDIIEEGLTEEIPKPSNKKKPKKKAKKKVK